MDNAELKPCPFCGNEAERHSVKKDKRKRFGIYYMIATVKCTYCGAQISLAGYDTDKAWEHVINRWNGRT